METTMTKDVFELNFARRMARLAFAFLAAMIVGAAAFAQETESQGGAFGDVTEEWCLDSATNEIYTNRAGGVRETLALLEEHSGADAAQVFDGDLVEAMDGADALNTSFVADAWETAIETFYGHDAFGQRIEVVGAETKNEAGDRCRMLKSPGFMTMFRAFWKS